MGGLESNVSPSPGRIALGGGVVEEEAPSPLTQSLLAFASPSSSRVMDLRP